MRSNWRVLATMSSFFLLLMTGTLPVIGQEINWRHDYAKAREEAKEKGLPMLLDFGTAQCSWCKKLDGETLRDSQVKALLAKQFVAVKIDGAKDEGLVQALKIDSFPTLVLAGPTGKILDLHEGYIDGPSFRTKLKNVLTSLEQGAKNRQGQGGLPTIEKTDAPEKRTSSDRLSKAEADEKQKECERLVEKIGGLYLQLAEAAMKEGENKQAEAYFNRVLQTSPGTRQAEIAGERLTRLR
jgi:thioredoxin-related protein